MEEAYYDCMDLEKAVERSSLEGGSEMGIEVPCVDEWLIRTVMASYAEACTTL